MLTVGYNWSLERGAIDPSLAEAASQQLLDIIEAYEGTSACTTYDVASYCLGDDGFAAAILDMRYSDGSLTDIGHDIAHLPELREVLAMLSPDELTESAFVNILDLGGWIRAHRDRLPHHIRVAALSGVALLSTKDGIPGSRVQYHKVEQGDVLDIPNPYKQSQRVMHKIRNIGEVIRVSLGVDTPVY